MKILIVDDEKDVETLFRQKFRKEVKTIAWSWYLPFQDKKLWIYLKVTHPR